MSSTRVSFVVIASSIAFVSCSAGAPLPSAGRTDALIFTEALQSVACGDGPREFFAWADHDGGHGFSRVKINTDGTLTIIGADHTQNRGSLLGTEAWLHRDGTRAYVRSRAGRAVYDVSAEKPVLLGDLDQPSGAFAAPLGDDKVLFRGNPAELYDLTDVANPVKLRSIRLRMGTTVSGVKSATRVGDSVVIMLDDDRTLSTVKIADLLSLPAGENVTVDDSVAVTKTSTKVPRADPFTHRDQAVFNVTFPTNTVDHISYFGDAQEFGPWVGIVDANGTTVVDTATPGEAVKDMAVYPKRLVSRGGLLFNFVGTAGVTSGHSTMKTTTSAHPSLVLMAANEDALEAGAFGSELWHRTWVDLAQATDGQTFRYTDLCWFPETKQGVLLDESTQGQTIGVHPFTLE